MKNIEGKRIAVCYFTYNHPHIVQGILTYSARHYSEAGIDIYYLDGSDNNETEKVIERFNNLGFTNIYYYHNDDKFPGERWKLLLQGEILKKEYDYIWPCRDNSFVSEERLQQILNCMENGPDVVGFGFGLGRGPGIETYQDAASYYRDWAWLATSLDFTIWKKSTIFDSLYFDKYTHIFGLHYSYLFFILAELDTVSIEVITDDTCPISGIEHNEKSIWEDKIFQVWKDDWIEINRLLPACYEPYKDGTIKRAGTLPWIFGGIPRLQTLHNEGKLVPEILDKVRPNWEKVSDVPFDIVEEIAYGTYKDKDDTMYEGLVDLLTKLTGLTNSGAMNKDQVPFDDIKKLMLETINAQHRYSDDIINQIKESIDDLENLVKSYDLKNNDLGNIIHILLFFVVMARH